MPNHVIYDGLWSSPKLARCSKLAAFAYPWVYLVADEWGRFEYQPRVIWGRVFGARTDVTADAFAGWLAEYEREGLLIRYEVDGRPLAAWTNFRGRPASRRHRSKLPAPPPDAQALIEPSQVTPPEATTPVQPPTRACDATRGAKSRERRAESEEQRDNEPSRAESEEARPGPDASGSPGSASAEGWIDHDPNDPQQAELARRIERLERIDADRDGRDPAPEMAIALLHSLSETSQGKVIERSLRRVSPRWIAMTLARSVEYARDEFDVDLDAVEDADRAPPHEAV